jgi:hypothetical protein
MQVRMSHERLTMMGHVFTFVTCFLSLYRRVIIIDRSCVAGIQENVVFCEKNQSFVSTFDVSNRLSKNFTPPVSNCVNSSTLTSLLATLVVLTLQSGTACVALLR